MPAEVRLRPTNDLQRINGQMTRKWEGTTDAGVPVDMFVAFFRVEGEYSEQFESEFPQLASRPPHPEDPTIPAPMVAACIEGCHMDRFTQVMWHSPGCPNLAE